MLETIIIKKLKFFLLFIHKNLFLTNKGTKIGGGGGGSQLWGLKTDFLESPDHCL
jgi:hypothetical protein